MVRLKECRIAAGMTQQYVASALGVKAPSVSNWESGKTLPTADNLIALADLYGVTIDYLLGRVPMNVEVKYEKPPALAEGQHEVSVTIPDGLSQSELESRLEQLVQRLVRQELHRQSEE